MRHLLFALAVASMVGGCASVDHERAERHHQSAKNELKHGNVGNAIDEQKASNRAKDDERHDRF
ncbi:MAG TPA: hypothetical protein VN947_12690 [Polyangia bacterium]|nr:hypothetical protein [Polyangia bacterium]